MYIYIYLFVPWMRHGFIVVAYDVSRRFQRHEDLLVHWLFLEHFEGVCLWVGQKKYAKKDMLNHPDLPTRMFLYVLNWILFESRFGSTWTVDFQKFKSWNLKLIASHGAKKAWKLTSYKAKKAVETCGSSPLGAFGFTSGYVSHDGSMGRLYIYLPFTMKIN